MKTVSLTISPNDHWLVADSKRWFNDSARLVSKCTKPDYEGKGSALKKADFHTWHNILSLSFEQFFVEIEKCSRNRHHSADCRDVLRFNYSLRQGPAPATLVLKKGCWATEQTHAHSHSGVRS